MKTGHVLPIILFLAWMPLPVHSADTEAEGVARHLLALAEQTENPRGICAVSGGGRLVVAMAQAGGFLVIGQEADAARMQAIASEAYSAGLLSLERVYVHEAPRNVCVMADDSVNLLVADDLTDRMLPQLSPDSYLRKLTPRSGKAVIGLAKGVAGTLTRKRLEDKGKNDKKDELELAARDVFNGQLLWKKWIQDELMPVGSSIVAAEDVVYVRQGADVLCLDARTGIERGKIVKATDPAEQVAWLSISDGVLMVLTGPRNPSKSFVRKRDHVLVPKTHFVGNCLTAWDVATGRSLWSVTRKAGKIAGRSISISSGRVFFGEREGLFSCHQLKSGKELWVRDLRSDDFAKAFAPKSSRKPSIILVKMHLPAVIASPRVVCLGWAECPNIVGVSARGMLGYSQGVRLHQRTAEEVRTCQTEPIEWG